jgi:hypothetical protein
VTKLHKVFYDCCHRGRKKRISKKQQDFKKGPLLKQRRKFLKCDCEFLFKIRLPISLQNLWIVIAKKNGEDIICVHTKHNGHELGFKSDKYFLLVKVLVIDFVAWKT